MVFAKNANKNGITITPKHLFANILEIWKLLSCEEKPLAGRG